MSMNRRSLRIDLTRDLPARAAPLTADATSKIFGGCIALLQPCPYNGACCSFYCVKFMWDSVTREWSYACGNG